MNENEGVCESLWHAKVRGEMVQAAEVRMSRLCPRDPPLGVRSRFVPAEGSGASVEPERFTKVRVHAATRSSSLCDTFMNIDPS